jgi:serine/threonine protein kinase
MLAVNQILQDRYQITRQLGHGGMGAVYEARDIRLGALVALKEILFKLEDGSDDKQQEMIRLAFEREAKILANLQHEAFPRVTDYFTEEDRQYLVMELIQGDDLGELLKKRGAPFLLDNVLDWAEQLLDALDYLHTKQPPILHRDIKPQNLKLTARGKVVLLDFGIAKGVEPKTQGMGTSHTFLAVTLNYSPIEQIFRVMDDTFRSIIESGHGDKIHKISGQAIDGRSDLYALGATLYHLMTGKAPVDSLKRTLETWLGNPEVLPFPGDLNPEIPPEISDFLLKAMEIESQNRFASARAMHQALKKAMAAVAQRDEEARKAVYWAEQLQFEEEEKRRTAEMILEAENQLKHAEDRASKAEKRLLDRESKNLKVGKKGPQPVVPTAPVDVWSFEEPRVSDETESLKEINFDIFKIGSSVPEPGLKSNAKEVSDFPLTDVDTVEELRKNSSGEKVGADTGEQETVVRVTPLATESTGKSWWRYFKTASFFPVLVVGLLAVMGILAISVFRLMPSTNNPGSKITEANVNVPTPEPTASPEVASETNVNLPDDANSSTANKPKSGKKQSSRPRKTAQKPNILKNPDCIFTDNCK